MQPRVSLVLFACSLWLCLVGRGHAGLAPTWDYCNCRWDDWKPWSDCTSTCFGTRKRSRAVWHSVKDGCVEFTDCASNDMGWDYQGCNEVCHNGGYVSGSWCVCATGYNGRCCSNRINCGAPDNIVSGVVSYPNTYYGATATYSCNTHYNLTGGSDVRTCQLTAYWSGSKPSCAYVNHCSSQPCQNGAVCTDLLDDYQCTCQTGWSSRHCENDIQPPVMSDCLADQTVYTTSHTQHVSWIEPTFVDPFGHDIQVIANYPSPEFTFPWGDYTVQYVGTKPSNGLQTECSFQIRVRPTPCDELNIPVNGARACNGWKTDYGRFCLVSCESSYTIDPTTYSYDTLYVCGASGNWIATGPLPDCDIYVPDPVDILTVLPNYSVYSHNSTCNDPTTKLALQELYIDTISAYDSFNDFCSNNPLECVPENVQVDCLPNSY